MYVCMYGCMYVCMYVKANWFDTLTVKQWETIGNIDVLLFSLTNEEETPYEQLPHH